MCVCGGVWGGGVYAIRKMSTNTIWLTIVNNTSNDLEEKAWRASLPCWICPIWTVGVDEVFVKEKQPCALWRSPNEGEKNNFLLRASSLERRLSWSDGENREVPLLLEIFEPGAVGALQNLTASHFLPHNRAWCERIVIITKVKS